MTKTQQSDWFWCSVCSGYHTPWFCWSTACSEVNALLNVTGLVMPTGYEAVEKLFTRFESITENHFCTGWYCNCEETKDMRDKLRNNSSD